MGEKEGEGRCTERDREDKGKEKRDKGRKGRVKSVRMSLINYMYSQAYPCGANPHKQHQHLRLHDTITITS